MLSLPRHWDAWHQTTRSICLASGNYRIILPSRWSTGSARGARGACAGCEPACLCYQTVGLHDDPRPQGQPLPPVDPAPAERQVTTC